jgi:hypothetical protein
MTETVFYVRPFDTGYFGPPAAQSAGETHFARSLFPPPPRAFQGLVRTRLLEAASPKLNLSDKSRDAQRAVAALVGEPEQLPAGWQIDGPFPVSEEGDKTLMPWLPAPQFLRRAALKAHAPLRAGLIKHSEDDRAIGGVSGRTDAAVDYLLGVSGVDDRGALGGWISGNNLLWALTDEGSWSESGHAPLPAMARRELRTGLALQRGERRAMDHMLYSHEDVRFDGRGGFLGKLTAHLPPGLSEQSLHQGFAPFGRANRLVEFAPAKPHRSWSRLTSGAHLPATPDESTRFWMMLLTPARVDKELFEESVVHPIVHPPSGEVRFLGALLGAPLTLGGYSIAQHRARSNSRYLPAGSCWLFELTEKDPGRRGDILQALNGSHCLGRRDEAAMGFGQVLIGIESCSANGVKR